MKRPLLILIIVVLGLATAGGAFWFLGGSREDSSKEEAMEEKVSDELPMEDRPFVSLTPTSDGHEFSLSVSGIPRGLESLEYELVYKVSSGITQGVPGSVKLKGKRSITRDLLLGTCSSGKCRYDKGVKDGTFTLRLRDDDGKLVAKFETDFHLRQGGKELSSADGGFSVSSKDLSRSAFYITMGTFGVPKDAPGEVTEGPYGVFTQGKTKVSGDVDMDGDGSLYGWNGKKWVELDDAETSSLGTFVRVASE
ncbi:hypothetical protein CMO96_02815 [Candidatus Woesebacteria bacterium]|nr:hypothetical protein [Candidatus Woesebacteria bacterium]|tara:strand:- start:221 stop:976 length:756 start_codon:yes stop_codon:yes gene_type:complete